jgi:hypothetical protein
MKSAPPKMKFFYLGHPREGRVLLELLRRPMPREQVDKVAGASNGPALIQRLRERGLSLPCDRADVLDRDGLPCKRGVYRLTAPDRVAVYRAFKLFALGSRP